MVLLPRAVLPMLPRLLRDAPFRRYWTASTVSMLGDGVTALAIPLTAAVVLHAGPTQMGLLNAAALAPGLFALHLGALADRGGRRRVLMIGSDLCAFALLASLPVCRALGVLTLGQLYAVVCALGLCSVLFTVCDGGLFASLVDRTRYVEGQSLLYGSQSVASLAGPSVGGLLVQVLSAPLAVVADALSFLASATLLGRLHVDEPAPSGTDTRGAARDGMRFIRHDAPVRTTLAVAATVNFFAVAFQAMLVLHLTRDLHAHAATVGLLLSGEAVGSFAGAALTGRMARRVGLGHALLIGSVTISAPLAAVPLVTGLSPLPAAGVFLALAGSGFGRAVQNVSIGSIFALSVPGGSRSRVRGAFQAVSFGTRAVGAVLAGLLGTAIGLRPTLWVAVAGGFLAPLWLLPSPLLALRLPEPLPAAPEQPAPAA